MNILAYHECRKIRKLLCAYPRVKRPDISNHQGIFAWLAIECIAELTKSPNPVAVTKQAVVLQRTALFDAVDSKSSMEAIRDRLEAARKVELSLHVQKTGTLIYRQRSFSDLFHPIQSSWKIQDHTCLSPFLDNNDRCLSITWKCHRCKNRGLPSRI